VAIVCPAAVVALARNVDGAAEVVAAGAPLPRFDVRASLVSLPRIFGTTLETIPADVPYIRADAQKVREWTHLFGEQRERLRVGLVWAGNPGHQNDRNRSLRGVSLAALSEIEGITFYSLQKGYKGAAPPTPPAGLKLVDLTDRIADFSDTAALVSLLDLVITVDTSVAHLAGAMARPVWVLLPKLPDWRWMLDRADSPWYPTMRLFRQGRAGDWGAVVQRVREALEEMTHTPSSRYSGERAGERG
jgi:hypothetical protein